MTAPPPWLSELQREWSDLLRSPLDPSSGTFRERRDAYPHALRAELKRPPAATVRASNDDRLALYHQQYWMRLFTTLQERLPRFALALGYWHFNHLASLHLRDSPPRHFDLERVADGFDARVETALRSWPSNVAPALLPEQGAPHEPGMPPKRSVPLKRGTARKLGAIQSRDYAATNIDAWLRRIVASRAPKELLQAALYIDGCERRVFEATFESRWHPTPTELGALSNLRIRTATSLELVEETWDLIARSPLASGTPSSDPPRKLPQARYWALFRTERAIARLQISEQCAAFLGACRQYPFGEALSRLEESSTPEELATVRAALPQWIQLALSNHWWLGASNA